MTFGLIVKNDNYVTQIDDNYENLVVIAEGTASSDQQIPYPNTTAPLVMLGPTPTGRMYKTVYNITGASPYVVISGSDFVGNLTQFSFNYRIYGPASSIPDPSNGFGLKVTTPSGATAFHGGHKYLRVRHSDVVTAGQVTAGPRTITLPGTFAPYVSVNGMMSTVNYDITQPDADYYSTFAVEVKSTQVVVRKVEQGPAPFYYHQNADTTATFPIFVTE